MSEERTQHLAAKYRAKGHIQFFARQYNSTVTGIEYICVAAGMPLEAILGNSENRGEEVCLQYILHHHRLLDVRGLHQHTSTSHRWEWGIFLTSPTPEKVMEYPLL